MGVYEDWKKNVEDRIEDLTKMKKDIPAVIKRCPKCFNLSLEYDIEKGRIYCTKCGFEEHIPMAKR